MSLERPCRHLLLLCLCHLCEKSFPSLTAVPLAWPLRNDTGSRHKLTPLWWASTCQATDWRPAAKLFIPAHQCFSKMLTIKKNIRQKSRRLSTQLSVMETHISMPSLSSRNFDSDTQLFWGLKQWEPLSNKFGLIAGDNLTISN